MATATARLALGLAACGSAGSSVRPAPAGTPVTGLRYVALGDSYTIGMSVAAQERFPDQLVAALGRAEPTLTLVANLATNGYTSRDVIDVELPALEAYDPEFVTLLIGVNDVVQGAAPDQYEANVTTILNEVLTLVPRERLVVVTIPDYTVTPQGSNYGDPAAQSAAIRANNAAMTRLVGDRGVAIVDIFDISFEAATDRTLVADDGLHPSGTQYARWVERLLPVVEACLGR